MSLSNGQVQPVVMLDLGILESLFIEQYGDRCTGGFVNPTVESDNGNDILFRCYYNNYDNDEDDVWFYGFDRKTGEFYAA